MTVAYRPLECHVFDTPKPVEIESEKLFVVR